MLLTGVAPAFGAVLVTLGSAGMVAIFAVIVRRQTVLFTITIAVGAACWLIGNAVWLFGFPIFRVVLWWTAFLVLTIVGEGLELSRLLRLTRRTEILFLLAVGIFLIGLVADSARGLLISSAGSDNGARRADPHDVLSMDDGPRQG